ncbi:maltokinase N-terminal cap-like domain-containing protein [Streptomyces beigongshangae]|uniref:maltokinase N-terminal cap-like domain-containing protein n=1 Tax=Streptomyces beigongshangae TaxID=2841597 RepID=UPI001C85C0AF|nr:maltokinase [Streptomyces sp. REN17]
MRKVVSPRPSGHTPAHLLTSLADLLRTWLPEQRWFAGKGRRVTELSLLSVTELHPTCLHLLVRTGQTSSPSQPGDCYQLFLGVGDELPPRLAHARIGRASRGPLAGLTVYDALQEPRSADLLLERLRTAGTAGPLRFERDAKVSVPAGLTPRLLGAEQSNTSLVYGDAYVLKVFRRVQPGVNPDLEVPWALARQGCTRVPAPVAWFRTSQPQVATLGVLQPFLPDAADGWTLALEALTAGRDFADEAHELGRATAEVHLALAVAFAPGAPTGHGSRRLAAAMIERLDATSRSVPELLPYAAGLRGAFDELAALDSGRPVQRIHGDLHLGQVLRAGERWFVIDFEGEPARPIAERRRPQSPVRDVAGMLRSFDYAARSRHPWRPEWALRCRDAYCAGYAVQARWDPRAQPELLRAYETDRAVYEALYEARHRPDRLPVPMAAIARLAEHHPVQSGGPHTPVPSFHSAQGG